MKLSELTSPFETKRVITYNVSQTKAVYHNKKVQHVIDNIYRGESSNDGYNEYCDIYMIYPEFPVGVWATSARTEYDVEEVKGAVERARTSTAKDFESTIKYYAENGMHIRFVDIEMMKHICPEIEQKLWESRKIHEKKLEKERQEREAKRKAEQEKYVKEMNERAQKQINSAIEVLKNGGEIKNDFVEIYKDYYDSSSNSIFNYLMRQYGVKVPLRTQGWINEKLRSAKIDKNRCESVLYWKGKNGKCSDKFFDCMRELIEKVNNK